MNKKILGFFLIFLMATLTTFAQDVDKGKKLFKDNCAACHNKNMKDKGVGPALGGVQDRWADYPIADLRDWIRNAPALIEKGHKKANEVWEEFKPMPMTPFPNLKDEEIDDMLAYIDGVDKGTYGKKTAAAGGGLPANFDQGKQIFKDNCAACHNKNMKDKGVGPGIGGSEARWADYPKEDLYSWVRNAPALIESGHKKANEVWEEFKPMPMTPFPNLKDDEIAAIFSYVDAVYTGKDKQAVVAPTDTADTSGTATTTPAPKSSFKWLYLLLFGILALLGAFLWQRGSKLEYQAALDRGDDPVGEPNSFLGTLFGEPVRGFIMFALTVGLTFIAADYAIGYGRQNGYQPDQPIKFSHKTHAGDNQIDCEFCHDGARRSRHSNVPEGSTCIKCHAAITKGSTYGTAELTKIYASLGWNPNTGKYIPNYNSLSEDQIKGIFTKWIKAKNSDEKDLDNLVSTQWEGIKSSLTNPSKPQIQGPVEWIRVHALPDHVYFNHSQHVSVGGLECQTCHGKVENMDVVRQSSPLSMGWCINCHRDTPVKFKDNKYYQEQFPWHKKQMEDGTITKVTVGDLGGLECQKCHY